MREQVSYRFLLFFVTSSVEREKEKIVESRRAVGMNAEAYHSMYARRGKSWHWQGEGGGRVWTPLRVCINFNQPA